MALTIVAVPVLTDNYVWLVHDTASGGTVAVDPAVAAPVMRAAEVRGWTISQIWNTHHHPDHVGGNSAIKAASGCTITGPKAEAGRIPGLDRAVAEGDTVMIGEVAGAVLDCPAHTAGHIAFHLPAAKALFCGDTLFAMGCGRLFEGTAEQMFAAMAKFAALPGDTRVYCAHEYTLANAEFALHVEPANAAIATRRGEVAGLRSAGQPSLPSTIALERATNPFMRAETAERLAELRRAKDSF